MTCVNHETLKKKKNYVKVGSNIIGTNINFGKRLRGVYNNIIIVHTTYNVIIHKVHLHITHYYDCIYT